MLQVFERPLSTILILLISIFVLSGSGSGSDSPCLLGDQPGICTPITNKICASVIEAARKKGEKPQICSVSSRIPYICCPDGRNITTPVSSQNLSSESPKKLSVSRQKCYEYGKLVYEKVSDVALIGGNNTFERSKCTKTAEGLIVNGQAADLGEYPHMALLGYPGFENGTLEYECGGSLISDEYVLTAAHCMASKKPTHVLLGELVLRDNNADGADPQLIAVDELIPHPQYKRSSYYNDVALIKLSEKPRLSHLLRPACLGGDIGNRSLVATGWGRTEYAGEASNHLMKVTLTQIDEIYCNNTYRDWNEKLARGVQSEQQLCVGRLEGGRDTCQGDSGGPLQIFQNDPHCTYNIVGVTSFGKGCALRKTPGVYARVEYFVSWIESVVWPTAANSTA